MTAMQPQCIPTPTPRGQRQHQGPRPRGAESEAPALGVCTCDSPARRAGARLRFQNPVPQRIQRKCGVLQRRQPQSPSRAGESWFSRPGVHTSCPHPWSEVPRRVQTSDLPELRAEAGGALCPDPQPPVIAPHFRARGLPRPHGDAPA